MWQWGTKAKRRAAVAAPPPDPRPYETPNPGGAPYVAANFDYSDGRLSPNYVPPTVQAARWRDKGDTPSGFRPAAAAPPEEWAGYERVGDYGRSIEAEHQINGREGLPLYGQSQHKPALNPYQYRIPDERTQRAPHEYDFERPFDQGVLGERQLNGMHYSAATIGLTTNPSTSLKGMAPVKRRISTFRLEPTEWGENTVSQANRVAPSSATFTSPAPYSYPGTFRLS